MKPVTQVDDSIHICVIGIGNGGCKTLNYFVDKKIRGITTIAVDTDAETLIGTNVHARLLIGDALVRGQGTRGNDKLGGMAAEESMDELRKLLTGMDIIFITTGLGGGTGSGAAPVVSAIAREMGALTIGIVTLPFSFEGRSRAELAQAGLQRLENRTDSLVVVAADDLVARVNDKLSMGETFDEFAYAFSQAVKCISELLIVPGLINLDFADMRGILAGGHLASMAFGKAPSGDRAFLATSDAINNLLGAVRLDDAQGVLFSITGDDLSLFDVNQAATLIRDKSATNTNILFGVIVNPAMEDFYVRMIAVGNSGDKAGNQDSEIKFTGTEGKGQSTIRTLKVFLCHSSADKPVVRKLYQRLYAKQGIDPWLDEAKLLPGEQWDYEIKSAVKDSDVVIVCLSKGSASKEGYVQKEMKRALDIADEKPEGTIFIIPLRLEECEVPERLSQWQWVNYYEEHAFEKLMVSLRKRAQALGIQIE